MYGNVSKTTTEELLRAKASALPKAPLPGGVAVWANTHLGPETMQSTARHSTARCAMLIACWI
jgi:hypothetical protein